MDEVATLNKQRDTLMTSLKEQSADDIGNYVTMVIYVIYCHHSYQILDGIKR